LFAGENVLEVKGMVDAFDDAGRRVVMGDALAQSSGVAIALGDEDGAGPGQME